MSRVAPNRKLVWFGLLAALALALYTSHKLRKMALIRGVIGDVPVERKVVVSKRERPARTRWCVLSVADDASRRGGEHEVQADCDYWDEVRIGDRVELVRLDGDVHLRQHEIYTSTGNFLFDFALLGLELAAVVYCASRLLKRRGDA